MGTLQVIGAAIALYCCCLPTLLLAQSNKDLLKLPAPGDSQLAVLTPNLLELGLVTGKVEPTERLKSWNFVQDGGKCRLPNPREFQVLAGGKQIPVAALGFRRRVVYAPLKQRDLRVGNYLYLQLGASVPPDTAVEVRNPGQTLWPASTRFLATNAALRWSPAIHVNQTGYMPGAPKKAMVGYYLGNLGELDLNPPGSNAQVPLRFQILATQSNAPVLTGELKLRRDKGFDFPCYQRVLEADFSALQTPGEYRLQVEPLGTSFPFLISDDVAGAFARTYALGIYHQRCGTDNRMPFTRFTHKPCHTAPAEVPDMSQKFASANESLAKETGNFKDNPRHTAPQLKSIQASLYPFVNKGPVDVRGGHHDAGDYSKYTINSAAFIHHLVFAADVFPGAAALDNLGLPESGDGKSDLLEEAKWEADFLARMQDADGGFYFLVYPRGREYENDVLPDKGDPQVVFPKTTSATAAATAALAQCASSPVFKAQFPQDAAHYLAAAKKGWGFLKTAIAKHGKDGAYQKITHYGDEFMHDDELAWAACELFLATGEPEYHQQLQAWLKPNSPDTRRWGWWRLYESYGNAIRSYAFAVKAGKARQEQLQPIFLKECEDEIMAAGQDQLHRSENCAYGTSFPEESKRARNAGWYFSSDAAFDLAVACQLSYPPLNDARPRLKEALWANLNYEQGCNPVNVTCLTGLGFKRQREIVDQYAQNDRRVLPPTGIPLGNVQAGFGWNYVYQKELDELSFPPDSAEKDPYPFYDRWGDAFNLSQEFVIVNQARAMAYLAWLMSETSLRTQAWTSATAQVTPLKNMARSQVGYMLSGAPLDLAPARVVWEAAGQEPCLGPTCTFTPKSGPQWVEAEAQLPDGRRIFGVRESR